MKARATASAQQQCAVACLPHSTAAVVAVAAERTCGYLKGLSDARHAGPAAEHAFETYDHFVQSRGDELAKMPVPQVARKYYESGDLYLFDEFQSGTVVGSRRPKLQSLRDVFEAIRDDEGNHVHTMRICQSAGTLRSPHDGDEDRSSEGACASALDCATSAPTGWRPPSSSSAQR